MTATVSHPELALEESIVSSSTGMETAKIGFGATLISWEAVKSGRDGILSFRDETTT